MIDKALIDRINKETDIVKLVSEFVSLEKRGKNYMGLCPFHDEKTPSFSVSPEKNLAVCMGCRKGGNPVTFLQLIKNVSYQDAIKELADRLGIEVKVENKKKDPNESLYNLMDEATAFYQYALKHTNKGQEAFQYLLDRGLTEEDINHFQIGFAPHADNLYKLLRSKGYPTTDMMKLGLVSQNEEGKYYDIFRSRIIFPIKDSLGRIVGFSGRTTKKTEPAKYINSTETPIFKKGELLYHLSDAKLHSVKQGFVVLNEGFFDVIQTFKAGLKSVVATMGTALTKNHAQQLKKITNHVVVVYDGDNAGIEATLKSIPILKDEKINVSVLHLKDKLDPDEYIKKNGYESYKSLFNDSLQDPYQFGYQIYLKDKDFKKSIDVETFKKQMSALLYKADPAIKKQYEADIYQKYHIQLNLGFGQYELPPKKSVQVNKRVITKAENAIDLILTDLLIHPKRLEQFVEKIGKDKLITSRQQKLASDIYKYYLTTNDDHVNLEYFYAMIDYPEALKIYLDKEVYKRKLKLSDNDFNHCLEAIEEYHQNYLQVETLMNELRTTNDEQRKQEIAQKILEIQKRGKV